jgi:hypothetical protein
VVVAIAEFVVVICHAFRLVVDALLFFSGLLCLLGSVGHSSVAVKLSRVIKLREFVSMKYD